VSYREHTLTQRIEQEGIKSGRLPRPLGETR
jgi:hypothetical protein